jgi:hypothetical protein
MIVAGVVPLLTHQPWLFPRLGPTVTLHVEKPAEPESSPRNTLIGHVVALLAGYLFLVVCGLTDDRPLCSRGQRRPRHRGGRCARGHDGGAVRVAGAASSGGCDYAGRRARLAPHADPVAHRDRCGRVGDRRGLDLHPVHRRGHAVLQ